MLPLEYYPPITNLLTVFEQDSQLNVQVFSTHNNKKRQVFKHKHIPIYRGVYPANARNRLLKLWAYTCLVLKPLWCLLRFKPDVILYFEPHSAFPAYIYKRFLKPNVGLFIHNHEYYAPNDFNNPAMASVQFFHGLETSFLYKKAQWISQTNKQRLDLFHNDYPFINEMVLKTLANYPPKAWQTKKSHRTVSDKISLLYIGALSFENTHIKALVDFVMDHQELLNLTIYSYNTSADVSAFLEQQNQHIITYFKEGIDYHDIPKIAKDHDIGLVLYNGHNLNYVYNAPNKLFEYIACGLNVWVPIDLKGCKPYLKKYSLPTVTAVDFDILETALLTDYYKTVHLQMVKVPYTCENELQTLIKNIKGL